MPVSHNNDNRVKPFIHKYLFHFLFACSWWGVYCLTTLSHVRVTHNFISHFLGASIGQLVDRLVCPSRKSLMIHSAHLLAYLVLMVSYLVCTSNGWHYKLTVGRPVTLANHEITWAPLNPSSYHPTFYSAAPADPHGTNLAVYDALKLK